MLPTSPGGVAFCTIRSTPGLSQSFESDSVMIVR
jgi:hypothetical protein